MPLSPSPQNTFGRRGQASTLMNCLFSLRNPFLRTKDLLFSEKVLNSEFGKSCKSSMAAAPSTNVPVAQRQCANHHAGHHDSSFSHEF
jgi:hypothetical protein